MKLSRFAAVFVVMAIAAALVPMVASAAYCETPAPTSVAFGGNTVGVLGAQKILIFSYAGFRSSAATVPPIAGVNPGVAGCDVTVNGQPTNDSRYIAEGVSAVRVRIILAPADAGFSATDFTGKICGSGFGFPDCTITGSLASGGKDITLNIVPASSSATQAVFDGALEAVDTLSASGCLRALASTDKTNDTDSLGNPQVTYERQTEYRTPGSTC